MSNRRRGKGMPKGDDLIRASPTQVKLIRRCERKWAFKYIDRLPEPTTAKQQFGTDGHAHMETWISKGTVPPNTPEGNTAKQLIRAGFVPQPSPALEPWVEKYIEIPLPHIHPKAIVIGYADLIVPPTLVDPVIVADYKFTSSLGWVITKKALATDPQAVIYGRWAMDEFGVDAARVRMLYAVASNPKVGPRKPAGSRKVEIEFSKRDPIFQLAWEGIERDVARIVDAKLNWKSANENAKPNQAACGDYGGCPFGPDGSNICQLPKGGRLAAFATSAARDDSELSQRDNYDTFNASSEKSAPQEKSMNLMDKIKQRQNNPTDAKPTPADAAGDGQLLARLQNMTAKEGVNPPDAKTEAPADAVEDPEMKKLAELQAMDLKTLKQGAKSYGIKGYSKLSKAALIAALMAVEAELETGKAKAEADMKAVPEEKTQQTAPGGPFEGGGEAASTDGSAPSFMDRLKAQNAAKGTTDHRAKKAELEAEAKEVEHDGVIKGTKPPADPELSAAGVPVDVEIEAKVTDKLKVEVAIKVVDVGLMVLFDCAMRKGHTNGQAVENLSDWIAEVSAKVARDNEVTHFGLIEFAKGGAALAAALDESLTANPQSGCILVDSYSLEGRAVKDVLIRHAKIVIQGVR